jgi:hypothetical protein
MDIHTMARFIDDNLLHEYLSQDGYKILHEMLNKYEEDLENDEDLDIPEYDIDVVIKDEYDGLTSYFIKYDEIFLHFKNIEQDQHLVDYYVSSYIYKYVIYYEGITDQDLEDRQDRQEVLKMIRQLPQDF